MWYNEERCKGVCYLWQNVIECREVKKNAVECSSKLQQTASHCITLHTLHHTAEYYSTILCTPSCLGTLPPIMAHSDSIMFHPTYHPLVHTSTLQHTPANSKIALVYFTHSSTLQHTSAHSGTLLHMSTYSPTYSCTLLHNSAHSCTCLHALL